MNRDQLRLTLARTVERHARTLQDHGGKAGPELIDDLERVADKHAKEHAERVIARRELREEAATPPLVAADPPATAPAPSPSSVARTRTRTRGGAK